MSDTDIMNVTPEKELVLTAFKELMGHIRKQDELVHLWTKHYLSIQVALAIALGFLVRVGPTEDLVVNVGNLFIPLLGITTAIRLTNVIIREHMWQGRYIAQIVKLPLMPEIYNTEWGPYEPNPPKRGYIAKQFWALRIVIIFGWILWGAVTAIRMINLPATADLTRFVHF